mmetsp:Transcript_11938/g.34225  ORF Transcript_11938/g.34225 Transcript_11938/m.34225 type:complete len:233 (+) Transcript_11938:125-823(+)|eukprot:CAMPEP_0172361176 /NCGR_PEP_ID=MMETSP1060-20121228/5057_1 /TAXON_ID=37318 /ORGANISM="Pseudo-nitzschia pungens, Strain cf. cingulata" /LENGTH=232 /DNA_ID=CAMNT_0013083361 /DNA_START=92 /DNA_END=790 /DNA_ORIENTATION=-
MGNAAAKLEEIELGTGSLQDAKSICKAFVSSKEGVTKIKNKGKTWVSADGVDETLLWKTTSAGMFKVKSVVEDSSGTQVATIITAKKGITSSTVYIGRAVPSFTGQSPLTEEQLKGSGIAAGTVLYPFSKIEASRKLTTAKCTYGIYTGADDVLNLYEGEKLSSLGFKAIFKEISSTDEGGVVVAKAYTPGMSMSPCVDAAIGVDMLAIVSMGYALAGDDSAAGALAGAGVV